MKSLSVLVVLMIATICIADGTSYSSSERVVLENSNPSVYYPDTYGTDALTFYTDVTTFETANPGLTTEDYSSTLVPGNSGAYDAGALDYYTDNSLFALNTLAQVLSLWTIAGGEMVVLTPPLLGITSVSVGPDTFSDDAVFQFGPPVKAFGCYIVFPNGSNTVDIEVFQGMTSLGTTSANGSPGDGLFWGVYTDTDMITRIEFNCPVSDGELFSNVQFGNPTVIERSSWGSIKSLIDWTF